MGFPRRVGAAGLVGRVSRARGELSKNSGPRGEARADVAHELERRGGVRVRRPIHTILEDQVLLGERLGLFTIPGRAERVRDVVREA